MKYIFINRRQVEQFDLDKDFYRIGTEQDFSTKNLIEMNVYKEVLVHHMVFEYL